MSAAAEPQPVPGDAAGGCCGLEELVARTVLHSETGHVVVRFAGCGVGNADLRAWVAACMLPRIEAFRESGHAIRQADLDVSHNSITDAGFGSLLKSWAKTGARCPLVLKANHNGLTDVSLGLLASFARGYSGQLRELHLSNNGFRSGDAVVRLLQSFAELPQYPMWIRRQRRYAPVYLRLGGCGLPEPEALLRQVSEQHSVRYCLLEEGRCSKTLCCLSSRKDLSTCPIVHLYGFLDQDAGPGRGAAAPPSEEDVAGQPEDSNAGSQASPREEQDPPRDDTAALAEPCSTAAPAPESSSSAAASSTAVLPGSTVAAAPESSSSAAASSTAMLPGSAPKRPRDDPAGRTDAATYLCGSCDRALPLDMFGRHQFRKSTKMDSLPAGAGAGGEQQPGRAPDHLTRRCNDCVRQPCSACFAELPLAHYSKGQMMRPHGHRRCRECTIETMLCARCGRPKPRAAFSRVEARKRKLLPRVCSTCEATNPYFERRYAVILVFGGQKCRPHGIPRLPVDILRSIMLFSEPGDEFIKVHPLNFDCSLCGRSWSLLTQDVERHVRHSQEHRQRLDKLERGLLVRIGSLDTEPSRFYNGLGIRRAVCSRECVAEAQQLVRLSDCMAQGFAIEALRAAGLAPEQDWVAPRVIETAMHLQLGSLMPRAGSSVAEVRSAQRRWKLFGHMGAEVEDNPAEAEELSALRAMLCAD